MLAHGYQHMDASYQKGLLRFYHLKQEHGDMCMMFNESVIESSILTLATNGKIISALDLLNQTYTTLPETNGAVTLTLEPYQSILLFCGESKQFPTQVVPKFQKLSTPFNWNISLYDTVEEKVIKEYKNITKLFNLNHFDACPNFSGKATYTTEFTLTTLPKYARLRIHAEGQTVEVSVNGSVSELQICNPFNFDISDKIQLGTNKLKISLCNTLANKIDEKYTAYLPIYAGGLIEAPDIYISEE